MQQVIIDCQTKHVTVIDLSQEEIDTVIADRQQNAIREVIEQRKAKKRLIISKLAELREMRQNRDIFDEGDITELQAEIDTLRGKLE